MQYLIWRQGESECTEIKILLEATKNVTISSGYNMRGEVCGSQQLKLIVKRGQRKIAFPLRLPWFPFLNGLKNLFCNDTDKSQIREKTSNLGRATHRITYGNAFISKIHQGWSASSLGDKRILLLKIQPLFNQDNVLISSLNTNKLD